MLRCNVLALSFPVLVLLDSFQLCRLWLKKDGSGFRELKSQKNSIYLFKGSVFTEFPFSWPLRHTYSISTLYILYLGLQLLVKRIMCGLHLGRTRKKGDLLLKMSVFFLTMHCFCRTRNYKRT